MTLKRCMAAVLVTLPFVATYIHLSFSWRDVLIDLCWGLGFIVWMIALFVLLGEEEKKETTPNE